MNDVLFVNATIGFSENFLPVWKIKAVFQFSL